MTRSRSPLAWLDSGTLALPILLAISALTMAPLTASADTLQPAAAGVTVSDPTGSPIHRSYGSVSAQGCQNTSCFKDSASVSYSDGTGGVPQGAAVSGSATASGPGFLQAQAESSVIFYYQVLGPVGTDGTLVPLDFTVSGSVQAGGDGGGTAQFIDTYLGLYEACANGPASPGSCSGYYPGPHDPGGTYPPSFSLSTISYVPAGIGYIEQVQLGVNCFAGGSSAGGCSGNVDPMIQIDPNFADASQYSVIFSPDVVQPAAVPEPSSLLLLGSGLLGGLGFLRRKIS